MRLAGNGAGGPCSGDGDTTLAATRDGRGQRPPSGEVRRCPARFALGSGRRGEVRRSGSSKTDPALNRNQRQNSGARSGSNERAAQLATLTGTSGNDTLTGTTANDTIYGAAGDDLLYGGLGNGSIYGGDGNDTLAGGLGNDRLDGGIGTDLADYSASLSGVTVDLATGAGSGGDAVGDTLTGIENILGSGFADSLTGDAIANTLTGGAGNDTLTGGAGSDLLDGGTGTDTADYAAAAAAVNVNLASGSGTGSGHDTRSEERRVGKEC